MEEKKGASNAQILWSACQALSRAVKVTPPGTPKDELIRPLESEIQAIYKAAREHLSIDRSIARRANRARTSVLASLIFIRALCAPADEIILAWSY
jgi:hypothetical protein